MTPIKPKQFDHIPLDELVDGALYVGHCRNATSATWHADRQMFTYVRDKFGDKFIEDIRPPELDSVYDVFYAVARKDDDTDPEGRKAFRDAIRASVGKEGK